MSLLSFCIQYIHIYRVITVFILFSGLFVLNEISQITAFFLYTSDTATEGLSFSSKIKCYYRRTLTICVWVRVSYHKISSNKQYWQHRFAISYASLSRWVYALGECRAWYCQYIATSSMLVLPDTLSTGFSCYITSV